MNWEAYSSFEDVSSDHRIVTITTTVHYDWPLLNNKVISHKYTLTLRNKFDALQEISESPTANDEYENFVNAHLEAAAECMPTKQRAPIGDISG